MRVLLLLFFFLMTAFQTFGNTSEYRLDYTDCFLEDCDPYEGDDRVRFAYLTVPEDRDRPEGRQLKIAVSILQAKNENATKDPIVFLSGGPGGKTFTGFERLHGHYLRQNRDLILLDFRGIGHSQPALCPQLEDQIWDMITRNLNPQQLKEEKKELLKACWGELEEQKIDPNLYTTPHVVKDLEALRKALGIQEWNLYGISYGTRISQAYVRDYPEGIRSVILDSPVPIDYPLLGSFLPSYRLGLNNFFETCRNSPECANAFPKLAEYFFETLNFHRNEPIMVNGDQGHLGEDPMYINFHDLHLTFHQLMYFRQFYPAIPWLIKAIEQNETEVFYNLYPLLKNRHNSLSTSIYTLVSHYDYGLIMNFEEVSENDPLYNALAYFDADEEIYRNIDFVDLDSTEVQPFVSDVPALILSGTTDPITPPFMGLAMTAFFQKGYFFEFPGVGHGVSLGPACARDISSSFIDRPHREPKSDCIEELHLNPVQWVPDLYFNPRIGSLSLAITQDFNFWILLTVGLLMLTLAVSFVTGIWCFFKKSKPAPALLHRNLIMRLTSLVTLIFCGRLLWYIMQTADQYNILILVGLIPEAKWIFISTPFIAVGIVFSLIYYLRAVKHSSLFELILYGSINIALVSLFIFFINYRLYPDFF